MNEIQNPLIPGKGSLILNYIYFQLTGRKILPSLLLNIKRFRYYFRHIFAMNNLENLVSELPLSNSHRFKIKFSALSSHISRSIPADQVLPVLIDNYSFLLMHFSKESIDKIFSTGLECWTQGIFNIQLIKIKDFDFEGSFALIFNVDSTCIYTLSFSFFQQLNESGMYSWALYIGRKQGQAGMLDKFRMTAKTFNDNKIVTLVLAAAEGLALALGIKSLIGVCTENQLSYQEQQTQSKEHFITSYNSYWETQESLKLSNGDYLMPIPLSLKLIEKIPAHHKKRTLLKRKTRHEISVAVRNRISQHRLQFVA